MNEVLMEFLSETFLDYSHNLAFDRHNSLLVTTLKTTQLTTSLVAPSILPTLWIKHYQILKPKAKLFAKKTNKIQLTSRYLTT
jgi:hypothetical protein